MFFLPHSNSTGIQLRNLINQTNNKSTAAWITRTLNQQDICQKNSVETQDKAFHYSATVTIDSVSTPLLGSSIKSKGLIKQTKKSCPH